MNTLVINLFAGPGASKSTTAAEIFAKLKRLGVNCEYVSEYAKDRTWQEDDVALKCQPYVTGKQLFRLYRLLGKVDVIVTDSPILLGIIYPGFGSTPSFNQTIIEQFNLFNNVNFLLERNPEEHPYNPAGRSQSEEQAKLLDRTIADVLEHRNIKHGRVKAGPKAADAIVEAILLHYNITTLKKAA